ncbi:MAG: murein biosynthesis integral membrane protein MurJ [bacterium]
MNKLIQQTRKLFLGAQGGMFSSAMILGFMIVVSRIFGFVRYRALAGYFTKDQLDIFFASFRIPDLVFELLITGALTSSLIPIYIKYQKNERERREITSSIFNFISLILAATIIILLPFLHIIIPLITPGFQGNKLNEIVIFSRILLLGQLPFLVLGNFFTGIAQARKLFLVTSIPPIIYNLSVIIATWLFAASYGLYAPIIGINVGAVIFALMQLPAVWDEIVNWRPILVFHTGVKDFFRMIGPRLLTILVAQIDATIDLTLTTLLGSGAYTIFYFAQHLQLLPVSVIGMAFGQASLPYLTEMIESKKRENFAEIITESLLNILFLTMPIAIYFIFARTPLVRMFFGGEKFDWDATVQTAFLLSYFAISIPFHSIYYLLTRCFYALLDSKTPFYSSIIGVVVNTLLSLAAILIFHLPVWSLGITFSLSIALQVGILFFLLQRKALFKFTPFFLSLTKIVFAAIIAAPAPYVLIKLMDNLLLDTTRTINILFLLLTSAFLYFLLYLFVAWFIGIQELSIIAQLTMKARVFQKKITEIYTSYD